jgi:hypothetical protein
MQLGTDNDATTGGNVSLCEFDDDGTLSLKYKYGFEYAVNLIACVKYTSGAKGCTGGTASPIEGFFSGFSVEEYESENSSQRKPVHSVFDSPHTVITGKQIAMGLPYTEIGVTSGQNIRIVIQESDSPDDETSYFPDILFRLK